MFTFKQASPITTCFFITSLLGRFSHPILLDIHLPVKTSAAESCVYDEALRWNQALQRINASRIDKEEEKIEYIDFISYHTPHATLYLADFNIEDEASSKSAKSIDQTKLNSLLRIIEKTVLDMEEEIQQGTFDFQYPCEIEINQPVVSGAYTMLDIQNNKCLQFVSDRVVNKTKSFVHFPSSVPDWVYNIDDQELREQKIRLIQQYGSPNVFEGFEPHVTVSFEKKTTAEITEWRDVVVNKLKKKLPSQCKQHGNSLALGYTSIGGTVLKGPIIDIEMKLYEMEVFQYDSYTEIV